MLRYITTHTSLVLNLSLIWLKVESEINNMIRLTRVASLSSHHLSLPSICYLLGLHWLKARPLIASFVDDIS
ncbi:hypothetical protein BGW80DRAFT_1317380 [Lactifluus volemus]|nr:hypothetical protein BGW80DRAFT_1317380 [Lactifluus volemus]